MARTQGKVIPLRIPRLLEVEQVAADLPLVATTVGAVAVGWVAIGADGDLHSSWDAMGPSKHALKGALWSLLSRIERDDG